MAHFFTADHHFGDDPVRQFFNRPFPSVDAMDAAMVSGCADITSEDDLWILGDFAAVETEAGQAAALRYFRSLPGRKHLIRGNHDTDWTATALSWTSVHDLYELTTEGSLFVLCHYPLIAWNHQRSGSINLFGHLHTDWRGAEGQMNVGVDQWNFRPVPADRAEIEALTLPRHQLFNR